MSVSAADFAEVEQHVGVGEIDSSRFAALKSPAQIVAFLYREAMQDGEAEEIALDRCELVIRAGQVPPTEARDIAVTLRRLGFVALSDRLREIAGRRQTTLRPLV
jgi:hypothetical protein